MESGVWGCAGPWKGLMGHCCSALRANGGPGNRRRDSEEGTVRGHTAGSRVDLGEKVWCWSLGVMWLEI